MIRSPRAVKVPDPVSIFACAVSDEVSSVFARAPRRFRSASVLDPSGRSQVLCFAQGPSSIFSTRSCCFLAPAIGRIRAPVLRFPGEPSRPSA
jgi:hypothetical protein